MLSILKGPKFEQILQKAQVNWNEYAPTKESVITAGIDSRLTSRNILTVFLDNFDFHYNRG